MQHIVYLLFLVLPWWPTLGGTAQDIALKMVPRAKDDPGGAILSMAQDVDGFFWFSTEYGLYKYDGYHYTSYHHEQFNANSLAAQNVWNIIADKVGNIWSTPAFSGLDVLDPASGRFTHIRHDPDDPGSLSSDTVLALSEDHAGFIWIGTVRGLDRYDPATKRFIHYVPNSADPFSISCNVVTKIYEDRQQRLWIGTGSSTYGYDGCGGLNLLDRKSGRFTRYLHDPRDLHSLINNQVRTIFEDSRGNFWIGTGGDGLHTMDRTAGTFERHEYDSTNRSKLSRPPLGKPLSWTDDFISFIVEDNESRIWIGSFLGGINVYDPVTNRCEFYGTGGKAKGDLGLNNFGAALRTRDNTLWIGSYGPNLYKLPPYRDIQQHVRTGNAVYCFAEDEKNELWIGTSAGLVHQSPDTIPEIFFPGGDPATSKNLVFYIERDGNKFWLVTFNGLQSFDPETKAFTDYFHGSGSRAGLLSDSIGWIKKSGDGGLWVASSRGLNLVDLKQGTVRHFLHAGNDPGTITSDSIFSVNVDAKTDVWVGTINGLNRFQPASGTFKKYLANLMVFCTKEDRNGTLWCGSSAGLYKYDRQKDLFTKIDFPGFSGKPYEAGWIVVDSANNLWMNSNRGILMVNPVRNNMVVYGRNQGVSPYALSPCGFFRHNGDVLWGDTSGYFRIARPALSAASAPGINIDRFSINNVADNPKVNGAVSSPLAETEEIRLKYDQNNFSFEFSNIDFISEHEDARLLYMLENHDNDWRPAGDERSAYYFAIAPGSYVFRARAYNSAGLWAEKAIRVIIVPPWWKSWWAIAAGLLMTCSMVYLFFRNHVKQLQRKQAEQMNIMVATQESERRRIARDLHDGIGTKLSALKMSLSGLQEEAGKLGAGRIRKMSRNSEQFISELMQDVRELLFNLSPAVLEEFGYATAVQGLVNKINETGLLHIKLVIFNLEKALPKETALALYRITQELVNNVLKHAGASNASLQVGVRDQRIVLMIEDDGKGFDSGEHRPGYGLQNLAARTKLLNGSMTIDSQPGKGTSISIEIPLHSS